LLEIFSSVIFVLFALLYDLRSLIGCQLVSELAPNIRIMILDYLMIQLIIEISAKKT